MPDVCEAGGTRDPMGFHVAFRGREPSEGALLRARGLVAARAVDRGRHPG